jgi:mannose-6-phosphate isomerase-like protein (cupin superfamily)
MQVRQVVTGHNAEGRAVFVRDEQVDAMAIPGLGELAILWSADEPATYPNAGDNPAAPGVFPPVGGIRFTMATYSPEFDVVAPEATPEMHIEEGDEPGMHRTDTTDFGVLLSGNVVVEVDDGAELLLSPGDVVVQNGTRHRWRVAGDQPATIAAFMIGAHHR